jgi:hypothetical protein
MKFASRRQGKARSGTWVGRGFGLALIMLALTPALARSQPDLILTVRVYNYAEVPSGTLVAAEAEAQRILKAAGVDAVWLDCLEPPGRLQSGANQDCAGTFGGTTVVLRILPSSAPAQATFSDTVFGFTWGTALASVFYSRVADFVHDLHGYDSEVPVLLGDAITHELGHLLLGPASHSSTGIMCTHWDEKYLRQALMARQFFNARQSAALRANLLRLQKETNRAATADPQP